MPVTPAARLDEGPSVRRAAQYVRMSTEHQQYSIANQAAAIQAYAVAHGLLIVRTYADEGRSGVRLDGRAALQQLIDDVQGGRADFDTVLVYDVSRWGRFQDADEGAYYEHLCTRAGIRVVYCVEPFANDGSLFATLIKGIKRAMAAEYSRELSVKTAEGKHRLAAQGFWQGGQAPYGMRRLLVDAKRTPKRQLGPGERKDLPTDRILLVPGPAREVAVVRWIYRMYVAKGWTRPRIAAALNAAGVPQKCGRPWTRDTVVAVLTDPKYAGHLVCRATPKHRVDSAGAGRVTRVDGALSPLVDPTLFAAALRRRAQKLHRFSDAEMLDALRRLRAAHGKLTRRLIDADPDCPDSVTYWNRFGGVLAAYRRIGYVSSYDYRYVPRRRQRQAIVDQVAAELAEAVGEHGGTLARIPNGRRWRLNDELTLFVTVARRTRARTIRSWTVPAEVFRHADLTLVVRLDATNDRVRDLFLFARSAVGVRALRLGERIPCAHVLARYVRVQEFAPLFGRVSLTAALGVSDAWPANSAAETLASLLSDEFAVALLRAESLGHRPSLIGDDPLRDLLAAGFLGRVVRCRSVVDSLERHRPALLRSACRLLKCYALGAAD